MKKIKNKGVFEMSSTDFIATIAKLEQQITNVENQIRTYHVERKDIETKIVSRLDQINGNVKANTRFRYMIYGAGSLLSIIAVCLAVFKGLGVL